MHRLALLVALIPWPALAEAPVVVADIAPIHALAARVMEGVGAPVLLVGAGDDPHSWQLRPSQARDLQEADVVFWVGPGLTPWLDEAIDGLADPGIGVELAEVEGITARPPLFAGDEHHEHHTEDAHEDGGEHAESDEPHAHDHGDEDPHVWLDPMNASAIVLAMADRLATIDPVNAEAYRANAAAAGAELARLDSELAATLAPVRGKGFVVFHDAYAHLAGRYGLSIVGALAEGDAADPGAAHVAELRDLIAQGDAACVFAEALHDDRLLLAATEGTSVGMGKLDPEGSALEPGPEVYPSMMRALAASLAECLSAH